MKNFKTKKQNIKNCYSSRKKEKTLNEQFWDLIDDTLSQIDFFPSQKKSKKCIK